MQGPAIKSSKIARVDKDHVLLRRKEYETLLRDARIKRELDQDLDESLAEALEEVRQGRAVGPFKTVEELRKSLEE